MTRRQALILLFAAIVTGSISGLIVNSQIEAPAHTIRVSLLGSSDDEDYDGVLVFKDHVESNSNGRVKVEIYPSGQYCSTERECLDALRTGVLQIFMVTTGGFGGVFEEMQAIDLPYLFRDDFVAECVLNGTVANELRLAMTDSDLGIRLMVISNTGGWRNFATTDHLIRTPEDVKGRKFRTITSPLQQEFVRRLGGNPTPIAWSEVYTSLATGVVDGTKNGIHDIVSTQLHEQIRFVTLDKHAYMGGLWWFSEKSWKELPVDLQHSIEAGFVKLRQVAGEAIKRREAESTAEFTRSGGILYTPTDEELAQFKERAFGMRSWYESQFGDEWLRIVDLSISACEKRAAAFRSNTGNYDYELAATSSANEVDSARIPLQAHDHNVDGKPDTNTVN